MQAALRTATTRSTSSTRPARPASPRAPRSATATSSTTATSSASCCDYTEADRVCIPVPFYHCFGMVMGNLACTTHGACIVIPAPGFDPAATLRAARTSGARRSTACRRCSSRVVLPDFADYDLSQRAHRHHGRIPLPRRADAEVIAAGITRDDDLLRHDRDVARLDADTARTTPSSAKVGTVGRVGPHLEIKVVDPETGETAPAGEPGEFCTRATR